MPKQNKQEEPDYFVVDMYEVARLKSLNTILGVLLVDISVASSKNKSCLMNAAHQVAKEIYSITSEQYFE